MNLNQPFLEIVLPGKKNLIIGCIYRHPSSNLTVDQFNIDYIEPLLQKISTEDKICSIMGETNILSDTNQFFNTFPSNFFALYILQPTRPISETLTDNIFLNKNKKLHFTFVDLEKPFDCVPRKVIWWAMRKLGIEEWIVRFMQAMYNNTRSRVRVNNTYSDEFGVKVGVHQGSVLSPLLFVIVLEALSCEFRTGTPWELLYADDLVISAETEEGLKMKLNKWKTERKA